MTTLAAPLAACHGTPVSSIDWHPNNIFDEALDIGGLSQGYLIAKEKLAKAYPRGSEAAPLLSYLKSIGSECAAPSGGRTVCQNSSYYETRSALWLLNIVITSGEILERLEYRFTTTIESSDSRIRSIEVTQTEVRIK
jgi:hypothetical protein